MSSEEFTVFCRNLSENVTEPILYELFLQAGPLEDVRIPMQDGKSRNFGFITYKHKCSVKYAMELFNDTMLFGKGIILQNRLLEAQREAEMRNRAMAYHREDEINSLRGGPPPNFSRYDDMNSLRGGMSRQDDINSLRGGSMNVFSRVGFNMMPRGFDSEPDHRSIFNQRFLNPYENFPMNPSSYQDQRSSSQSYDRYGGRSYNNRDRRYDHNDRGDRDNSRRDDRYRENSRHGSDNSRNYKSKQGSTNSNHRSDRGYTHESRHHSRRSRSRERSPLPRNSDRHHRR